MPLNGQSIGKDVSLAFVINGRSFSIPPNAITSFTPKPRTSTETRQGLDGGTRDAVFPNGWEGNLDVDRLDPTIETFWSAIEEAYYSGQDTGSGTITETITNPNGSISQWRYTRVVFKMDDAGERKADSVIKQRLSFMAARRIKVQ